MRIAQVAPLAECVPPRTYGGIERVVYYLTEGLVQAGHDVTLFASGDSRTSADLAATTKKALRLAKFPRDPALCRLQQLVEVVNMAEKFDLVHFHTDLWHFPV